MSGARFAASAVVLAATIAAQSGAASAQDWSDTYVGISAGYGALLQEDAMKGLQSGIFAGINIVSDPVVVGVEAEVSPLFMAHSGSFLGGYDYAISDRFLASARARIGLPMDGLLPYFAVGLALKEQDFAVAGPGASGSYTLKWLPTFAAGVEAALSDHTFLRLEGSVYSSSRGFDYGMLKVGAGYRF